MQRLRICISIGVILVGCLVLPASAQICETRAGNPMEIKIHLSFDDSDILQNVSAVQSGNEIQMDTSSQSGSMQGGASKDFAANLGVSVQLQDSYGTPLHESTPRSDGLVTFGVCSQVTYRLRIHGPEIQEYLADSVQPFRDRMIYIALHRKQVGQNSKSNAAMIAASRLHIPGKALKQLTIGNLEMKKGDLLAAKASYEKAIELYVKFDQAYNNLGVVLMKSGDIEGGKKAFEKAVELNDRFASAYVNLAKIAFDRKDFHKAYELSRKALASEPLNPSALFIAAEAAYFVDSFNETITITRTLHMLPHNSFALAHFLSGKSFEVQNLMPAAIAEYGIFIKEDPLDPNVPIALQAINSHRDSSKNDHE
jgi:tetratricopeptide (TPR) repeat protein